MPHRHPLSPAAAPVAAAVLLVASFVVRSASHFFAFCRNCVAKMLQASTFETFSSLVLSIFVVVVG